MHIPNNPRPSPISERLNKVFYDRRKDKVTKRMGLANN
jgi:hypothetical protein